MDTTKDKKNLTRSRFVIITLFVTGLIILGVIGVNSIFEGDPDDDPRWFRDVRTGAWSYICGSDIGILSVKQKLETMYGSDAPKIKVDVANSEFSEGNWHYEFAQLAKQSLVANNYLAATGYYSIAAFPFLYGDKRAPKMYKLALDSFQKALNKRKYPHKIITVNINGENINVYIVYPQSYQEGDAVPAIITTGGIDGLMTFTFADYLMHWNKVNIAWVGVDMHGHGTSVNLKLNVEETHEIHVAVIKSLRKDVSINNKNIFVHSRSWGGHAALKLLATNKADELDVGGISASCAIGENIFSQIWLTLLIMPKMTRNVWGARAGINPDHYFEMMDTSNGIEVSDELFWGNPETSVPLLVLNTADDNMNPISEIKAMAALSKNGRYFIVEDEKGHCPSRSQGLKEVAKFVKENMR